EEEDDIGGPSPAEAGIRPRRTTDDAERYPEDRRVNRQRQCKMGDEPVLADLRPIGETALDHVPAEPALGEAQQQNAAERRYQPSRQPSAHQKPDKGQGISDADQPPEQPMSILPPVNALELVQRHCVMDEPILGDLLVFCKFGGPVGSGERRDDADHRLPLGNRQTGQGQPRDAADHDHQKDQTAAEKQPDRDRTEPPPFSPRTRGRGGVADSAPVATFGRALVAVMSKSRSPTRTDANKVPPPSGDGKPAQNARRSSTSS